MAPERYASRMDILVGGRRSSRLLVVRGVFLGQQDADEAPLPALVLKQHDAVD